jgi:hypothetical protein
METLTPSTFMPDSLNWHSLSWLTVRATGRSSPKRGAAMTAWLAVGNGMAGFAVGLFLHAIPGSWWPRWLRELVGKKE